MQTALAKHGDLVNEYFGKSIAPDEPMKFSALHAALWKTGAFLYVPRDLRVTDPAGNRPRIQRPKHSRLPPHTRGDRTRRRGNARAEVHWRSAPLGSQRQCPSVHASGTEVFVKEGGHLHYISLQNFSPNVFDFTLKRAHVARDAEIDWVLGMFGARSCGTMCNAHGRRGRHEFHVRSRRAERQTAVRPVHQAAPQDGQHRQRSAVQERAIAMPPWAITPVIIKVEKNANGTNAYQANRNLVLSDKVKCDTRPDPGNRVQPVAVHARRDRRAARRKPDFLPAQSWPDRSAGARRSDRGVSRACARAHQGRERAKRVCGIWCTGRS